MNKEDILGVLESIVSNPGSYKSGEYLEARAFKFLFGIKKTEKQRIVEALQEWIKELSEPRTMLAVRIAQKMLIIELIPQIKELRHTINNKKVFPRFYLKYVDEVLTELQKTSIK